MVCGSKQSTAARCRGDHPRIGAPGKQETRTRAFGLAPNPRRALTAATRFREPLLSALWRGVRFSLSTTSRFAPWEASKEIISAFPLRLARCSAVVVVLSVAFTLIPASRRILAEVMSEMEVAMWRGVCSRHLVVSLSLGSMP